jgi:hypothetical protein
MPRALTPDDLAAAVDQQAAQPGRTPARARRALLSGPIEVAGILLHPPSLGPILILEEIGHPMFAALSGQTQAPAAMTVRDSLRLIFTYACPMEADEALRS